MKLRKTKYTIICLVGLTCILFYTYGRSIWFPHYLKFRGYRTVAEVINLYGSDARSRLKPDFEKAGISYPPKSITLLAIKDQKTLELWSNDSEPAKYIKSFKVRAASGKSGPKLVEGDRQVPEGHYKIIGLNPNSSYHLSMKLNYPNDFDLKHAKAEGRHRPGSNIFIHGKALSIGCLAMGDEAAEDLFVLASDVGINNISVVISPEDPRIKPLVYNGKKQWGSELYSEISKTFLMYVRK